MKEKYTPSAEVFDKLLSWPSFIFRSSNPSTVPTFSSDKGSPLYAAHTSVHFQDAGSR